MNLPALLGYLQDELGDLGDSLRDDENIKVKSFEERESYPEEAGVDEGSIPRTVNEESVCDCSGILRWGTFSLLIFSYSKFPCKSCT